MRKLLSTASTLFLSASFAFCAKVPATNQVRGEYIEARSADVYTGPCFANSEIGQAGDLAVMGWRIEKGNFDGVTLDGLSVMGVVKAHGTLGDYAVDRMTAKSVLIVDESANAEQRLALKAFAQRMGGSLLEDVVRVEYRPITFSMADNSVHSMKAVMQAGELAKLETRALTEKDQICHNESVWYQPLSKMDHAMAAYTVANDFKGIGLGTSWNFAGNRGSFLGTFQFSE
jgi:hypothetical protein